jgi:EmrB/QacA subfamily drug resistance transporter
VISLSRGPCDLGVLRTAPAASVPCGTAERTRTLAATVLGSSLAFIDGSVVNVALPAIQRDLAAGAAGTQWVMNAYLVVLGALVLIGGASADRFGRRRVFVAGIVVFTAASILCGLAPGTSALVAARAVQGAGAALLVPASLALLGATFPEGERARAIGAWAGYGALAMAAGPMLGGFLTDHVSWRAIFYLNVPLAVAAAWLALRGAPDSRSTHPPGLDWPGAGLAAAGLAGLTWGLTTAAERGFRSPAVVTALVGGVVAIAAFVATEARVRSPMLPLGLFRSRAFTGANLVTLLLYFALSGVLFFLPFELIRGRDYSATAAGAALLPFPAVMGSLSGRAGALADRYGTRLPLTVGPLVAALGFLLLAVPLHDSSYWVSLLPALLVLAAGMTITVAPLTTAVMSAVGGDYAGTASGVNNAVARVAGVLAIATLSLVFIAMYDAVLHDSVRALGVPGSLPAELLDALSGAPFPGGPLGGAGRAALFTAFQAVALAGAGCAACAGLIAWGTMDAGRLASSRSNDR